MRTFARMSRIALGPVSILALVLAAGLSFTTATRADDAAPAKETGTITGRVVDSDGKPVANVHVRVFAIGAFKDMKNRGQDKPTGNDAARPQPIAKAETAADGTFALENVPVGKVRVIAGLRGTGIGMVKIPVEVNAGETTKVDDIILHKPATSRPARAKPGDTTQNQ
jgi:hypothetical protein